MVSERGEIEAAWVDEARAAIAAFERFAECFVKIAQAACEATLRCWGFLEELELPSERLRRSEDDGRVREVWAIQDSYIMVRGREPRHARRYLQPHVPKWSPLYGRR